MTADLDDEAGMVAQVEDMRRHRRRLVDAGVLRGSARAWKPVKVVC